MDSFNEFTSLNFLHTFGSSARNLSFTNAAKKTLCDTSRGE